MKNIREKIKDLVVINYVIVQEWKVIDFVRWSKSEDVSAWDILRAYDDTTQLWSLSILEVEEHIDQSNIIKILEKLLNDFKSEKN